MISWRLQAVMHMLPHTSHYSSICSHTGICLFLLRICSKEILGSWLESPNTIRGWGMLMV